MDCHDEETSKGNLSLEGIKGNLVDGPDLDRWEKVLHQLELGQMPPKKKPNPPPPSATVSFNGSGPNS